MQNPDLISALTAVIEPITALPLPTAGKIKQAVIDNDTATVHIAFGFPFASQKDSLMQDITAACLTLPNVKKATIELELNIQNHAVQTGLKPLAGIKNIIAVASGKGGVGKSTTTVNLALALLAESTPEHPVSVGIMDADIYGPSIPRMLGSTLPDGQRPEIIDQKKAKPVDAWGLKTMSIAYLVKEGEATVWRGPMVSQALQQLISETAWGELDYLIIDLPPGTGDIQLSLAQRIPVAGAVIVTTPQDIALLDARKGINMFEKVKVPTLGIIENMSTHICSQCGHTEAIFGEGGGDLLADEVDVPLLGQLPLDIRIRMEADSGAPTVVAEPESDITAEYRTIAQQLAGRLAQQNKDYASKFPNIVIENS